MQTNIFYLIIIFIYTIIAQNSLVNMGGKYTNIINPIFWLILFVVMCLNSSKTILNKKKDKKIIEYTAIIALVYIVIYTLFGLVVTFGKNPYSNTFKGFLNNLWVTGTVVIAREYARFRILKNVRKKYQTLIKTLVIAVLSLLEFELFDVVSHIKDTEYVFKQVVSILIPTIAKNILFTEIAQRYSCKAPIIYEMFIKIFYWVSPILPNSPWILIAILDTAIPLTYLMIIKTTFDEEKNIILNRGVEKRDVKGTVIFITLLVVIVCFANGIFPIYPRAVATASMYPEIHVGDVVIVQKKPVEELKEKDIIEYQIENQFVIHRIINIENEEGTYVITTMGDNNSSPDAKPVYEEQVKGKVIFKIKYLGLPSFWLNKLLNSGEEIHVETGR